MILKKYAISAMALAVLTGGVSPALANNELNEEVIEKSIRVAKPVINVKNKSIKVGDKFNPLSNVTTKDVDGTNLTEHVIVTYNNVNTKKAGVYKVGYAVLGKKGQRTDVEIAVTVVGKETVINSTDMILSIGTEIETIDFKKGVTAIDATGVDISQYVVMVENNVNTTSAGTYNVKYVVLDTKGNRVYHTRSVVVKEGTTIKAEDRVINKGEKFNPLENVTAKDITGADLTNYIVVTKNTVDTTTGGVGQVTYVVLDTQGNRISKTINVTVVGKTEILVGDMEISTGNHDFNPLNYIKAIDVSGLDITQHVIVVKNTVNTYKAGEYEVVFRVLDTEGVIVDKAVKVTVVGEDIATDEESAQAVIDKIDKLPEVIQYSDYKKISEARNEYEKLSESAKKLVSNIDKLVDAEVKIQAILEKVHNVVNLIGALPEDITLDDKAQIEEARNAYENLTDDEKKGILPTELSILEDSERRLAILEAQNSEEVKEVVSVIEDLPNVEEIKLGDVDAIRKARKMYEELPENLKSVVDITKLVEAENKLDEITPEHVKAVQEILKSLPSVEDVTIEHVATINEFSTKYNKLTPKEQNLVADEMVIIEYEFACDRIEKAQPIIEMIDALPEVNAVKIADKAKVEEVREAYNNAIKGSINAGVDKYVTNYKKLQDLENKIAQLEAKVDEVKGMLTALPTPEQVALEHVGAINALSTAYNQLTPEQKKLVAPDEMVIVEYEFVCDRIEKAQPIIKMIADLPNVDEVSADDAEAVQKVRDAYTNATTGSLNAGVDKYVTNYNKLVELEAKIAELTQS